MSAARRETTTLSGRAGFGPLVAGGCGVVLAALWIGTVAAGNAAMVRVDGAIIDAVAAGRPRAAVVVMTAVTDAGSPAVMTGLLVVVTALLALRHGSPRPLVLGVAGLGGASALDLGVKCLVARPRPPVALHAVVAHGPSLPSGHVTVSAAVVPLLVVLALECVPDGHRPVGWSLGVLVMLLIGTSRVYLGVHYPSDVVAGWLLGGSWIAVVLAVDRIAAGRTSR